MSHFVALMVLTCLKYPERSLMLHQWIQVAAELRASLGDLYGFSAIMTGLQHPQVLSPLPLASPSLPPLPSSLVCSFISRQEIRSG